MGEILGVSGSERVLDACGSGEGLSQDSRRIGGRDGRSVNVRIMLKGAEEDL